MDVAQHPIPVWSSNSNFTFVACASSLTQTNTDTRLLFLSLDLLQTLTNMLLRDANSKDPTQSAPTSNSIENTLIQTDAVSTHLLKKIC